MADLLEKFSALYLEGGALDLLEKISSILFEEFPANFLEFNLEVLEKLPSKFLEDFLRLS